MIVTLELHLHCSFEQIVESTMRYASSTVKYGNFLLISTVLARLAWAKNSSVLCMFQVQKKYELSMGLVRVCYG